jgi:hypothetical protein
MCRTALLSSVTRMRSLTRALSRTGIATIAVLVFGACASLASPPAAAAVGNYCLSSDANMDCSFTSLAQCEATASGGLGECKLVVTPATRGPQALYSGHSPRRVGAK